MLLASSARRARRREVSPSSWAPSPANQFWAKVEEGALEKGKELGVEVIVLGSPAANPTSPARSRLVEDQLDQGHRPASPSRRPIPAALAPIVGRREAGREGRLHRPAGRREGITYVGTDNEPAPRSAAKYICDNVEKGSDVAILQGVMAQSSTARPAPRAATTRSRPAA